MDRRLLVAALALVALAGCYAPELERCSVRCSTSRTCPDGWSCGADDFCHETGDPTQCGGGGADARPDAPVDGGVDASLDSAAGPDAAADAGPDAAADAAP